MARRRRRKDSPFLGFLILIAIVVTGVGWVLDKIKQASPELIGGVVLVGLGAIVLIFVVRRMIENATHAREVEALRRAKEARHNANLQRRSFLLERYQDAVVVDHIMLSDVWHDMTKEQLIESWGRPDDIDTKVLKTKVKETFKYDRVGQNRFSRRVYIENDLVVGWER